MIMTDIIQQELAALLAREGGFIDHPADRGGPTCYGITEQVARAAGYNGPMTELPRSVAEAIYRQRYWLDPGFDRVARISERVAVELFDTGVNMGPRVAIGFLQRALNALNRRGRDWPDIQPTRQIDEATIAALTALRTVRKANGEVILVKTLNCLQGARYIELSEARPANEAFTFGWLDKRVS